MSPIEKDNFEELASILAGVVPPKPSISPVNWTDFNLDDDDNLSDLSDLLAVRDKSLSSRKTEYENISACAPSSITAESNILVTINDSEPVSSLGDSEYSISVDSGGTRSSCLSYRIDEVEEPYCSSNYGHESFSNFHRDSAKFHDADEDKINAMLESYLAAEEDENVVRILREHMKQRQKGRGKCGVEDDDGEDEGDGNSTCGDR